MGRNFDLNKQSLQKIDWLLPRLKHSVLPSIIIKWLENPGCPKSPDFEFLYNDILHHIH